METEEKEMNKKRLITVSLVLIILFLIYGYIYCNLKVNSVYYAKHTPHKKGTEPVLMMLVDNLYWIYQPDVDGIEYDFDGPPAILTFDKNNEQTSFFTSTDLDGKQGYLFNNIITGTMYDFDYKFKMEKVYSSSDFIYELDPTTIDEHEAKNNIHDFLKPLIDQQTAPFINLQWIFDKVYKDKFN